MATTGFTGVQRPTNFAPRYQGGSITNPHPGTAAGGGAGGRTNRLATEGAKAFKEQLGLPSFEDLFAKLGGGQGTREYGNAGAATEGAGYLRGELDRGRDDMRKQMGNINRARAGIRRPTQTSGFKSVLNLATERLGNQAENDRRLAAAAASRRGFVGGYNPEANEQGRREAVALAGSEAAQAEREAQQKLFEGETGLYTTQQAGRNAELGGYTDLTKTAAELPTKWLDSLSGIYGGSGGFGDIFRTSSGNVQFDTDTERSEAGIRRSGRRSERDRWRGQSNVAGMM